MITIFHSPMSRSTRILWLLEELKAPYQIERISILRPDGSDGPDPANPHPLRQVPVIEDDGAVIVETMIIILHLVDKFPQGGLAPQASEPARAEFMEWLGLCIGVLDPILTSLALKQPLTDRQEAARTILADRVHAALQAHRYLLGASFSAADLVLFSYLRLAPDFLGAIRALPEWIERINARPALASARALDSMPA